MLQEASKSGKLDEALELLRQEKEEVVQAAPEASSVAVRPVALMLGDGFGGWWLDDWDGVWRELRS